MADLTARRGERGIIMFDEITEAIERRFAEEEKYNKWIEESDEEEK